MNNLITFSLILAGMLLLLLRKGTKRQRRANRRLATTLLLFGLASGGYTYTQQHTSLLGTPPQSSSVSNSVPATDGTSRQPVTQLAQLNYNNTAEI
ncbi:MAG: DNA/RNA non-specific endonuclease, partial [Lacticaseibacillus paracasei]